MPSEYGTDFIHPRVGTIELKTLRLPVIYPQLFVNCEVYQRKVGRNKFMVLSGVNDFPEDATEWYAVGWLPYESVAKYRRLTRDLCMGISAECYAIFADDLDPVESLLGDVGADVR